MSATCYCIRNQILFPSLGFLVSAAKESALILTSYYNDFAPFAVVPMLKETL